MYSFDTIVKPGAQYTILMRSNFRRKGCYISYGNINDHYSPDLCSNNDKNINNQILRAFNSASWNES